MGGIAAMNSINRVMKAHGNEILEEMKDHIPASAREETGVDLEVKNYSIQVLWTTKEGGYLPGPEIGIDELAERYPDCNVGY